MNKPAALPEGSPIPVDQQPFPGSSPGTSGTAARAFVVGRFAVCTIGGSIVANVFDWSIEVNFDYADSTAHGDAWKQKVFLDGDWTARGRGYLTFAGATTYIKSYTSSGGPTLVTFIGYADGPPSPAVPIWQGTAFIQKGRISVPM